MITNCAQNIKSDLVSNAIKCGALVLLAFIVLGLFIAYTREVVDGVGASFDWIIETFILVKDGFYSMYTYWIWLPLTVTGVFIAAYVWMTCLCAAMKKKYFMTDVYYHLDTAKACALALSIIAVLIFPPVTAEPQIVYIFSLLYALVTAGSRLTEMNNNEIAARSLSEG
jgi:hypothetical protein